MPAGVGEAVGAGVPVGVGFGVGFGVGEAGGVGAGLPMTLAPLWCLGSQTGALRSLGCVPVFSSTAR